MFNRNKLSAAIVTVVASLTAHNHATAQDSGIVEEVMVTGIRASLEAAMDIKRDSAGVVDAISAEDIGKFPDTNLAESLQRITGVSIDRVNGEGSSVTIRGFGGGNNLVLLNGRHMPAASAFGGNSSAGGTRGFGTRSFDFANLASESVRGIQVYKTGRASIATGGIGGTINIETTRPLNDPGLNIAAGVKAAHDASNEFGDDVTPELSALLSWTDEDEMFGASVSGSWQVRDSAAAGVAMNDWNLGFWQGEDAPGLYNFTDDPTIVNAPADGQMYARPNDVRYSFADRHRERINGQLTLQYRPMETLTLTGDVTYAENYLQEHRGEQTFWFANGNNVSYLEFDDNAVKIPMVYTETGLENKDMGYEQQWREQRNTLESMGFNAEWLATDVLTFTLDAHNSSMESLPVAPAGAGSIDTSIAAPIGESQSANFRGEVPIVTTTIDDSNTNNNGQWDLNDFGTQIGRIWMAEQTAEIDQLQLDGAWEFDDIGLGFIDNGRFDFGVASTSVEVESRQSNRQMEFGNWGVSNPGDIPAGLIEEFSFPQYFDDVDMTGHQTFGVRATDPVELMRSSVYQYRESRRQQELATGDDTGWEDYQFAVDSVLTQDNHLEEDITSFYVQLNLDGEIAGMAMNILAGLRYEDTDVYSQSITDQNIVRRWVDNNDFVSDNSPQDEFVPDDDTFNYNNTLPSIDFSLNFTDNLKGRASYSKTIARPGYGSLAIGYSNFNQTGTTLRGATPTANTSNPRLLPLESENLDLSLEWYYDDTSYASIGVFDKKVENFIGTMQVDQTIYDMRDVTAPNEAQDNLIMEAQAALQDRDININDTSLFVMASVLARPDQYPGGAADVEVQADNPQAIDNDFHLEVAGLGGLEPSENDPLTMWRVATPTNNREASLYGAEFAVQHFFGETGFGLQANYTIVNGDVKFDDLADPSAQQFALLGLSDSANLVGIYERDAFSARIALNWRDKFLNETNRGTANNPTYVEEYHQFDVTASYDLTDQFNVFFEGLNITGENIRRSGRNENQIWYFENLEARYNLGVRYTF